MAAKRLISNNIKKLKHILQFRHYLLLGLVGILLAFADDLYAGAINNTWNGSVSTNWSTAGNWDTGIPTTGHDIIIPTGLARYPVLTANSVCKVIKSMGNGSSIGGAFTLTPSGSSTIAVTGNATISCILAGIGNLILTNGGTLTLSGNNTYTGWTWINNGTLSVPSLSNLSVASPLGAPALANGQIYFGNGVTDGTLLYTGTGHTTNRGLSVDSGGDGIVDQSGASGLLKFTGAVAPEGGGGPFAYTITLRGSAGGTGELGGVISNGDHTLAIVKEGTGTWTLSGTNTYTGGTTISQGTLLINGSQSGSAVSLNGGTLGGTGTAGTITSTASGGTLSPGSPETSTGILNSGNVNLSAAGTRSFVVQLNGTTAGTNYDQLNVTGTVDLTGATLSGTVGFVPANGNTFTIVANDGADLVTGTFAGLPEGATVTLSGYNFTISYTGGTGNDVVLTSVVATFTWDGGGSDNNWTTAANWTGNVAPGAGDNLLFDATGVGARPLPNNDITAGTSFGTITVAVGGYTIGGNTVGLSTGLTASNASGTSTVSLAVNGAGAVTKSGAGTLTLSGANSYIGVTTVSAGVLNIQNATALGTTAAGTSVTAGAALQIQGGITVGAEALTLNGTGISTDGALRNISGTNIWQGTVTLGSAVRINSDAGSLTFNTAANSITATNQNLTLGGAAGGTVSGTITTGTGTLTKDGAGTWTLSGTNTYTGGNTLTDGVLSVATIGNGGVAGNLGGATNAATNLVLSGGTLRYTGATASTDRNFTLTAGTTSMIDISTGGTTLTLNGGSAATTGGLTKIGSGTLLLNAANAHTGTTTVNAGTLAVDGNQAKNRLASGAQVTVNNGGTFEIRGLNALFASTPNQTNFTVNSGGTLRIVSGTSTFGGTNSHSHVGNLTLAGGTVDLSYSGAGTAYLNESVQIDGSVTVTANSTIQFGTGATNANAGFALRNTTFTVDPGVILNVSAELENSEFGDSFSKSDTGTMVVSGSNTYTGGATITAGTLRLGAANSLPDAGTMTLNGGTFNTGATVGYNETINTLTLTDNSAIALGTGVHTLTYAASNGMTWTAGKTIIITGWTGGYNGTTGTSGKIFVGNSAAGLTSTQLSQILFDDGASYYPATILASGEVVPTYKTITTGTIAGSPFCAGSAVSVPFTITGTFAAGNVFTAQLSNGSGSFASPASMGTLASTVAGTINATIPVGTLTGTGYRIRVVGDSPVVTGSNNGTDLTINALVILGFLYERNITIDYTKVDGGSDLYNFPVFVNLTGQNFLQTEPAGHILNANGFDISFTDTNYNLLDHQLEYYNGTNGDLIAWVRIPILSSSSNTVIKILYGNPQITTDPSVTSVWDSHYKGVWHLDNNSLNDFTFFNKAGTPYNSPTYPTGMINNSLGMNGTNQYVEVINDPNINFAGNITVSAWVNMNAGGRDQKIAGNQNNSSGGYKFGIYTNNKVEFEIRNAANTASLNRSVAGGTVLNTGQWYYLAGISSDVLDSIKTFVNGIPERPFKKTGILGSASDKLTIGKEPWLSSYYFSGRFDELRISDAVRSNGWMRTEYNNQSSPSTFYALDAVGDSSYHLPSEGMCTGPITLTFGHPLGEGTYSGNPYIVGDVFTPPSAGSYPITYTYNGVCSPTSITKTFIMTEIPPAPVASDKEYCTNQIAYLEATSGENIRWYSGGILVSNANPYSTGQTAAGTYNYTVTQTVNSCESSPTAVSLTLFNDITINTQPQPSTICEGGNAIFTVAASGYNLTYQWQEDGVNISNGGIFSGATTSTLTLTNPGIAKSGKLYGCVVSSSCGASPLNSSTALLTVNALPVATFSYTGTPYYYPEPNPNPTFSGGGIAGTFSAAPAGLVFVSTATGQVDLAASTAGSYTVTNTIAASGGCGVVTADSPINIITDLTWTGAVSTDWNVAGNWTFNILPVLALNAVIPNVTNKPILSTGDMGTVKNLTINAGSSLTVTTNTLQIAGTITNNGAFTATDGTIEMKGSGAQVIAANLFTGNTISNLTINNAAGVTLQGTLNLTGIVTATSGNLATGEYLTLVSLVSQTALINGSGTGNVTGDVTMQRYLPSGFGYKYVSSPFQSATVNEFSDNMTLGSFTFYKYDESRTASGWVSYSTPANILNPLEGYAVNFGSNPAANTFDVTGAVNNGNLSVTLYNHNNTYTQGFNLTGNPYPSPIDWNAASGWTKTNIDNALYYFKASATDEYAGTYSTYINGVSSDGIVNNIIPSMQGFFVHVTNGAYPVTATLGLTNNVRIADLTHAFSKKGGGDTYIPLLRLTAVFSDDLNSSDPAVIYFDEKATSEFNNQLDALKLMNTDQGVPNLYALTPGGTKLSIDALPEIADSSITIPIGLTTYKNGEIIFRIRDIENLPAGMNIYLHDALTGINQDLMHDKEYKISISAGEYSSRFSLKFLIDPTDVPDPNPSSDLFTVYCSNGILKASILSLVGNVGILDIYDLVGHKVFVQKVYEEGYIEFNPRLINGIYIIRFMSGNLRETKKIFIKN